MDPPFGSRSGVNVAFVSNVVYPFVRGGAEKRIYEIGRRLAQRGHSVTIYCRHFWDGPKTMTHEGMVLRAVGPRRPLYVGGRRSIAEALEFAAEIPYPLYRYGREHDVVVVSVFPYFPVFSTKLSTTLSGTPIITTWHEVWGQYWEEYLRGKAPFGKLVEWLAAKVPQHPIAVSETTADKLATIGPPRERIRVVPNGVDVERIRSITPADDGFDVLFAGRLIAEKNVDLVLSAFDGIAKEYDLTLGIIGDGPELRRLRSLRRRLDHPNRVTFLGFLEEYDDVIAHMRAADVFVSPSIREGFGITYIEAMAAGCTVVAARHPDSAASEVVGDGGFLVDPSVPAIESVLESTMNGESLTVDPKRVAERYDWKNIAEQAMDAYCAAIRVHQR